MPCVIGWKYSTGVKQLALHRANPSWIPGNLDHPSNTTRGDPEHRARCDPLSS